LRYGVLADVHANAHALDAVVGELERRCVDGYLCAGDLVGYGPFPNECVRTVAELSAVCVAGNHDLIALGRLSDNRCIQMARDSLAWTRDVLTDESICFLASLPLRADAPGGVVVAHGSLHDPQEYTARPEQARAQLQQLRDGHRDGRVLVLGHTHRPWAFTGTSGTIRIAATVRIPRTDALLLNPGAVGQSRELRVRARCAVLDLDSATAVFIDVPYDLRACRRALRHAGLARRSYHLRPSLLRASARGLRIAAHRVRIPSRGEGKSG
jgi:predicted phosphodiesterase